MKQTNVRIGAFTFGKSSATYDFLITADVQAELEANPNIPVIVDTVNGPSIAYFSAYRKGYWKPLPEIRYRWAFSWVDTKECPAPVDGTDLRVAFDLNSGARNEDD